MTLPGLLFANLFRHRTRTTLTLLSLMVAFLLFMLLRAIAVAFAGGVTVAGMDRLIVDAKYSMTDNLPLASVAQVRTLDGVADVAQMNWFGAYYQDPKNGFAQFVVDPEAYFHVYQELIIDPDVLKQFIATRIGVVASTSLAQKFGWHAGDALPLRGTLWPKQDGSWDWQFQFVGTFDYLVDPYLDWVRIGRNVAGPTIKVNETQSTPRSVNAASSRGVKWRPAVGAAIAPARRANTV